MMYKKICKHKKIIILCLVFFMSFNIISDYKEKNTYAIAGVDDLLYYTLGLLVLSTGVVAVSDLQIKDMGKSVNDLIMQGTDTQFQEQFRIETLEAIEKGQEGRVYVTDTLKNILNSVAENLPTFTKNINKPFTTDVYSLSFGNTVLKGSASEIYNNYAGDFILNVNHNSSIHNYFTAISTTTNNTIKSIDVLKGVNAVKFISYIDDSSSYKYCVSAIRYYRSSGDYYRTTFLSDTPFNLKFNFSDGISLISSDLVLPIPYSNPIIKSGYNPTYTDERLKEGQYIPIPQSIPTDTTVSTEMPLDWDSVKDNVRTIPTDSTGDTTGDITGDITGDTTGESSSLWDWLKDLLNSILNAIKGILAFLLSLIESLINAIKDLLTSLFVPTVSVSELFSVPAGTGIAYLGDLFNWDSIFNIEPRPYEFTTDMQMNTLLSENEGAKNWHIELKLFDTPFMKNNINLIRNVLSYSLLISVIYFVIYHFIPKRDMD